MRLPPRDSTQTVRRLPGRRSRGFALAEVGLALLVAILGVVFLLSLAGRSSQRRNRDRYLQDLRVFSAAFADYYQRHNGWPASTGAEGVLPPELEDALAGTDWHQGSPFGGNYGWVAPGLSGTGSGEVTLTAFAPDFPLTLDRADLLDIDRRIDDGNLATGRFRAGFNGWPVYLVEAARR